MMTFNNNLNLSPSNHQQDNPAPNYRPSVPISLYRELAAELEVTQGKLIAIQSENQTLRQQNQELRQEIERIANQGQKLQELVASVAFIPDYPDFHRISPESDTLFKDRSQEVLLAQNQKIKKKKIPRKKSKMVEIRKIEPNYSSHHPKQPKMNGWFLFFAMLLVIFTSFAASFLLLRLYFASQK